MSAFHPLETRLADAWPPEDMAGRDRPGGGLRRGGQRRAAAGDRRPEDAGEAAWWPPTSTISCGPAKPRRTRRWSSICAGGWAWPAKSGGRGSILAGPAGGDGLEAAARQARYQFLEATAARLGARYRRHRPYGRRSGRNDPAPHPSRHGHRRPGGHGPGPPLGPATLIRPLLGFPRAELLAYLNDLGQSYRDDSSNQDTAFTRNRIRHELLPRLAEQFNAGVVDALLRLGSLAGEVQAVIDAMAASWPTVASSGGPGVSASSRCLGRRSRPIWSASCSCSFGVGRAGRCRRWVLPNGNSCGAMLDRRAWQSE